MQPSAAQLKAIFDSKAIVFRELKKYVKPIAEFVRDEGLAELRQEEEHIFLERHFFGKDTGLLSIVEKLIELNSLLLSYEKPEHLGTVFVKYWDKIIELVRDEQYFLINYFKKTLLDVIKHRGFKPYWDKSFEYYRSFLKILRLDLTYFSLALQTQTKTTIHWVINLIHDGRIDEAFEFVEVQRDQKIMSKEEVDFFSRLIANIKHGNYQEAKKILQERKDLLEEDEFRLLVYVLNTKIERQPKPIYILILHPLNSEPESSIDIVSFKHESIADALEIGKSDDCDIQIVDSKSEDNVQARIVFSPRLNRFAIIPSENTIVKINNLEVKDKSQFLNNNDVIDIGDYSFSVNIRATDKIGISDEEYERLFQNKILKLKRGEIEPSALAKALAEEAKQWEVLRRELPEGFELREHKDILGEMPGVSFPIKIDKMPSLIEESIEEIEEVAPEVEKLPEVKKFKKSKWRRLRAKFRLAKIKAKKWPRNKKQSLIEGWKILDKSIRLRKKLSQSLKFPSFGTKFWNLQINFSQLAPSAMLSTLRRLNAEFRRLEETLSALKSYKNFDLQPFRITGRRIWAPIVEDVKPQLEAQLQKVRTSIESTNKIIDNLESSKDKKIFGLKTTREFLTSFFQSAFGYKQQIQQWLLNLNLKRKSQKVLISLMLVPLLIGTFPTRVGLGSAFRRARSPEEILKVLKIDINDPANKGVLQASAFVDNLTQILNKYNVGDIKNEDLPPYIKELISDEVLDVAVFVGAEREKLMYVKKPEVRFLKFGQQNIVLRLRYVDNIKDAIKAFEESDVIYVDSHSRYGLGWALSKEGMGSPLRMQTKPIKIPKKELYGYKGPVLKDLGKEVIVQPSDEDLKRIKPRKGYQLITMASCSSGQHFLEAIKRLRQGLPTTVIYTNTEVSSDVSEVLLRGLLTGKKIEEITKELNELERLFRQKNPTPYEAVVLNAEAGSVTSKQYDKYNLPKSFTLFYDIET